MTFDPKSYWENRLSSDFSLRGVGDIRLPASYNKYLYTIRADAFDRAIRKIDVDLVGANVLDIGSGTGFYIDLWQKRKVAPLQGCDLTAIATQELSKKFPTATFCCWDAGSDSLPFQRESFDIISAFDVFFHIVDDTRFEKAITNVSSLLKPGGVFIYSDNLMRDKEIRMRHLAFRKRETIIQAADKAGLKLRTTLPMFFIMNTPVVTRSRLLRKAFNLILRCASSSSFAGMVVGAMLFPVEFLMVRIARRGPGTEIAIFEKRATDTK